MFSNFLLLHFKEKSSQKRIIKVLKSSVIPVTLSTLQNKIFFSIVPIADGAGRQACTGSTLCVIVLPFTSQACRRCPTVSAPHTPAIQSPPTSLRFIYLVTVIQEAIREQDGGKSFNTDLKIFLRSGVLSIIANTYYACECMWLLFKNGCGNILRLQGQGGKGKS